MTLEQLHEPSNTRLLSLLPDEQMDAVFGQDMCDIDCSFLGFVGTYERLAEIIPSHWTIVDLGCAYAPQAYYFKDHAAYVGVDLHEGPRFCAQNTTHYVMPINDFIAAKLGEFNQDTTFAICNYVPPWGGGDNMSRVRMAFKNVFTFYPAGDKRPALTANERGTK